MISSGQNFTLIIMTGKTHLFPGTWARPKPEDLNTCSWFILSQYTWPVFHSYWSYRIWTNKTQSPVIFCCIPLTILRSRWISMLFKNALEILRKLSNRPELYRQSCHLVTHLNLWLLTLHAMILSSQHCNLQLGTDVYCYCYVKRYGSSKLEIYFFLF